MGLWVRFKKCIFRSIEVAVSLNGLKQVNFNILNYWLNLLFLVEFCEICSFIDFAIQYVLLLAAKQCYKKQFTHVKWHFRLVFENQAKYSNLRICQEKSRLAHFLSYFVCWTRAQNRQIALVSAANSVHQLSTAKRFLHDFCNVLWFFECVLVLFFCFPTAIMWFWNSLAGCSKILKYHIKKTQNLVVKSIFGTKVSRK